MLLREQAEARAALSDFFEQLWPGPDCPSAESKALSFEQFGEIEQRYRRAQRTMQTLKQNAAIEKSAAIEKAQPQKPAEPVPQSP